MLDLMHGRFPTKIVDLIIALSKFFVSLPPVGLQCYPAVLNQTAMSRSRGREEIAVELSENPP